MASRTKAALAMTEADQELHRHLAQARRHLERAADVCGRVARERGVEVSTVRARVFQDSLDKAMKQVNSIGYLAQGVDLTDPDLVPEQHRLTKAQARLAALRAQQREARQKERDQARADARLLEELGWLADLEENP